MKITFVCPAFSLSGGCRVIATYADKLRRRGHDVLCVGVPSELRPVAQSLKTRLRFLLRGGGWNPRSGYRDPTNHFELLDVPRVLLESWRPIVDADLPDADVVIATWWHTAEWVAALAPRKGAKVYFIQHHEADPDWIGPKFAARAAATYKLPLHPITIAGWLVDILRNQYGRTDVDLVHNAVDLELFHAPSRGKQPRLTVGFMSSKQPLKATNVALQAIQYSLKHQPDLKVLAFGRDHPATGLPLPPDFDFAQKPPQAQIASIYANCDAFLWPSLREGFGLPILESMACRTPVISTRTGIAPDIIEDGVNGYLVDPNDPHAIADRIQRVAELSDNAWRTMSDAAFAQVSSYSWDDAANLFEQSLIQTAAASPAKNK